jgi:hypothetical protein
MPSSEDKIVRSFYDLPMTTQPSNLLCREAAQFNHALQRTGGAVPGHEIFEMLRLLRGSRRSLSFCHGNAYD